MDSLPFPQSGMQFCESKLLFFPNPLPPGSKADLPYEIQPPFEVLFNVSYTAIYMLLIFLFLNYP